MRTENWPRPTLGLVTGGKDESGNASEIYGPLKAGLTTTHRTQNQQLSESLSSLEKRIETLESKYLEVLGTFLSVTEHLVKLGAFTNARITIDKEVNE